MASPKTPGHPPESDVDKALDKLHPPRPTAPPSSVTRPARATPSPARAATDADGAIEAALDATHRTSTSLSSLLDTLGRFTSGISGAQEASEQLKHELLMLRQMLGTSNQERLALKVRVTDLEAKLEELRYEGVQEHHYVREEQDRFIAALMEEYETEIERLKRQQRNAPHAEEQERRDLARRELEALSSERELSRNLALRAQQQRDAAQRELARVQRELRLTQSKLDSLLAKYDEQHALPTEPPPSDLSLHGQRASLAQLDAEARLAYAATSPSIKPASRRPLDSELEERWEHDESPLPPPSFSHSESEEALRRSSPPAELRAALTHPRAPSVAPDRAETKTPSISTNLRPSSVYPDPYRVEEKPPLKRKPDHSLRPLVGYRKSADEIEPERLGTTPRGSGRDRSSS